MIMEVKIQTLTPIWTGGVQAGKVDHIHETGILGSMRWWYEAIVRGLGGEACDPTSEKKCTYNPKNAQPANQQLCPVCYLFGATGWKRRFRVEVQDSTIHDKSIRDTVEADRSYRPYVGARERIPTWHFPKDLSGMPCSGELAIQIQSLSNDFDPNIIVGLIQFIADWASIGARAQMGFGVIQLINTRVDTRPLFNYLQPAIGRHPYPELPSLQNIFLARISSKDGRPFDKKETFNLKYDLRQVFKNGNNTDLRHFVMGATRPERTAAKVKMSRPYNDGKEIRVWGWIPEELPSNQNFKDRDAVVQRIYQHLKDNYTVKIWREMNSSRDIIDPRNNNSLAFLRTLLKLEEGRHA
jgi:CRISPR-associated protein Cmr1